MSKHTIGDLRKTVELIDSISQDAFSRISSLCRVSLLAMEQHGQPVALEDLAQVLQQIEQAAHDAENCINVESEAVGCNYKDPPWHRRLYALAAWDKRHERLRKQTRSSTGTYE